MCVLAFEQHRMLAESSPFAVGEFSVAPPEFACVHERLSSRTDVVGRFLQALVHTFEVECAVAVEAGKAHRHTNTIGNRSDTQLFAISVWLQR